jgi:hypothetical protein
MFGNNAGLVLSTYECARSAELIKVRAMAKIKHFGAKKPLLSITKSRGRAKRIKRRQVRGDQAPGRLGKLVEPWLTLANFWPGLQKNKDDDEQLFRFATQPPEVPEFPGFALSEIAKGGKGFLVHLAEQVHGLLGFCSEGPEYGYSGTDMGGVAFYSRTGGDFVTVVEHVPLQSFNRLITRIPHARLGRCTVCGRFFYRWRTGAAGTKDCSAACANVRRVRKSRGKKDRYKYANYLRAEKEKK